MQHNSSPLFYICTVCGLVDEATYSHSNLKHTHNVWNSCKKQGFSWVQHETGAPSWFTSPHVFSHPTPPAWSEINMVMVTRGCEMRCACLRRRVCVCDPACSSGNSRHSDYGECVNVYGNGSQVMLSGNRRGHSRGSVVRVPLRKTM